VGTLTQGRKVVQTWSFRGSKSRNKVSVGEPAEGSLKNAPFFEMGSIPKPCIHTFVALASRLRASAHADRACQRTQTRLFSDV
jgi:hypothetical protein